MSGFVAVHPDERRRIAIDVGGQPVTQGSKNAVAYQGKDGRTHARAVEPKARKEKIGNWRADVKAAADRVTADMGSTWTGPLDGPLQAIIWLTVPPAQRPKRVRWLGQLVEAVHWPWQRPDLDKYIRATFDALTAAGVWLDDAQVVDLHACKTYPNMGSFARATPGALIRISQLTTIRVPAATPAQPPDLAAALLEPAPDSGQPTLFTPV